MRKLWQLALVAGLALSLAAVALAQEPAGQQPAANQAQVPQPQQGGVNWKGVGVGAGTIAGNVLYVPAKLVYGIMGGIAGGAGYLLTGGNQQVANTIWRSSLGGDYVLTPEMVTGKQAVHFSGPTATAPVTGAAHNPPAAYGASAAPSSPSDKSADSLPSSNVDPLPAQSPRAIDKGAGPITAIPPASSPDNIKSGDEANRPTQAFKPNGGPLPNTSIE